MRICFTSVLCACILLILQHLACEAADQAQKIKVIGAGLPRTGTSSLKAALDLLGFQTFHFQEMLVDTKQAKPWLSYVRHKATIKEVFSNLTDMGYTATLDFPTSEFFKEQMELFPDAKIILTVRDKPQDWSRSLTTLLDFRRAILDSPFSWKYPNLIYYIPSVSMTREILCHFGVHLYGLKDCELAMQYHTKSKEWLDQIYEKHNSIVISKVPKEKLLIFNAKEGWGPLCDFLGLPIPSEPFPNANSSRLLNSVAIVIQIVIYLWIPLALLLTWKLAKCMGVTPKRKAE